MRVAFSVVYVLRGFPSTARLGITIRNILSDPIPRSCTLCVLEGRRHRARRAGMCRSRSKYTNGNNKLQLLRSYVHCNTER